MDSRRRQATYTSLPARQYVFRVQASNKDGVWNEKGVTPRPHGPAALVGDLVVQEPDGSGVCGLDCRRVQIAGQ